MNYEKDIRIDQDALDIEWLEQPRLMLRYARMEAEGEKEYNEARASLDVVKASLDKKIRSAPENYDIAKLTEAAVTATIAMDEEHQESLQVVHEALYNWNMAKGAVRAFHQRKDALENLVRLHGQQYFAGPSVPRDLGKEWERKQQQKKADAAISMKRKK